MSWFDTTGFANLAKSALKEAQKTIDKALDIKDEEQKVISKQDTDFFETWGVKNDQQLLKQQHETSTSIWGSFTGSFFENPKSKENSDTMSKMLKQSKSFPESADDSNFPNQLTSSISLPDGFQDHGNETLDNQTKRLSIVSSESGKKSLESVEVLTSHTDTITTPDSDANSNSNDVSPSIVALKVNSDSSEGLITSPSSVEILGDWKSDNSPYLSSTEHSSDISPYESPLDEMKSKVSLDNIHQVLDSDEVDQTSIAEDSYASASESTVMTTSTTTFQSPEQTNLYLPLQTIVTQPIRKFEHLDNLNKKELNTTIEPLDGSTEPQQIQLTDSSCEGTLIESSSEDNPTLINNNAEPTTLTGSSYVKNMLADAMAEKAGEIQDCERNSPISSESRSDLVKIGSDQTSGHTSGDELETTTSSDIEIISSPNGDSSSTQSRQSPAKLNITKGGDLLTKTLKIRGHSRELSEISIASDETNFEIEKLLKRIQEMSEILEARESKLIDISRMNMELQEHNNNLKRELDNVEKKAEINENLNEITDEYTQRLSALEKKFQQTIRERDCLRKNLEQLKLETASSRMSHQQISTINAENDEIIKELREEGEKLSKQQLQQSNIIKKLRIKEKDNELFIKNQKEQIEEQSLELDRLKRSLNAKEDVERSQIEAVHVLTAKTKKQEKELIMLKEQLETKVHKMEAYKQSLDAAKIGLVETKENLKISEDKLKEAIDNAGESCQLFAQVQDLKIKLRNCEESSFKKEEKLKHEINELIQRAESAETRNEELSESLTSATKPLLRQLEQLQMNLTNKSNNFNKQEKLFTEKNHELENKILNFLEVNRSLKEENITLKTTVTQLQANLNTKEFEMIHLQQSYDELKERLERTDDEIIRQKHLSTAMEETYTNQIKELKRDVNSLENKLAVEKAATEAEKRKFHATLEQQQSVEEEFRLSPTLSVGRESISSVNSIWPGFNDSVFESSSGRYPNFYESLKSGTTPIIENLQAQSKQKDGEIQQLQWELSRKNVERDALNSELTNLTLKLEDLDSKLTKVQALNENLSEIQTRYDALLQMYGEKVEENQELRLDLEDVKEMYKTQIDHLMKRDDPSR